MLLQSSVAVVATTVEAMAFDARRRDSAELTALIEAHKSSYAALRKTVDHVSGSGVVFNDACRTEEDALMAICVYPAATEGDRCAKASYLLEIEARGELDLEQHMQAILRSMMWTG
ncbi:hypothetical protein [Mesorhizobium sp. 1M-11]|uniref:hypothetical protein n=1 Tax=Mesorhizobium sp. 1M-11 TaxID=1529006 RepID=UPI001FCCFDE5|nr:hypothetical protein [Mesorhizobium sp. 1M-11]